MDKESENFIRVELENSSLPSMYVNKRDEWVYYGDENDYPNYLINLANRHAEHNAILTGKVNYIAGDGIHVREASAENEAVIQKWITKANRFETWQDIILKITQDIEWFNGCYLQLTYGVDGKIAEYYHVKFANIRISKCGKYAYYCENWVDDKGIANRRVKDDPTFKKFNLYNKQFKSGTCIFQYKHPRPSSEKFGDVYPIPDYVGAIRDIACDVNVTDHLYNKVTHGLTSNAILTIYGTDPSPKEKRKISEGLKKNHAGQNNAGNFYLNFAAETSKGIEITTLDMPNAYEQFQTIEPRNEKKIFSGHKVTSKTLFGIATEGALGQRTEMLLAFELFKKTYIDTRRAIIEDILQFFAKEADLEYTALYIKGISPLDTELELDSSAVNEAITVNEKRKYLNKQFNLDLEEDIDTDTRLTLSKKLGTGGTTELMSVINSSLPPEQKANILQVLFGISEKKAKKMLALPEQPEINPQLKLSKEEQDEILTALLACAEDDNEDEILEEEFIETPDQTINYDWEFKKHQKFYLAEGEVITTRKAILDLLAGNPSIKLDVIAKQLAIDLEYVETEINGFIERGLITESIGGFTMTQKGLKVAEELDPTTETEIYTVYKYALRPEVPKAKSGSRPFCKALMASSNSGKTWKREKIDNLSNQFNTNVWLFRGGFYHNPDTNQTTAFCRHIWKAVTKIRRK